MDQQTAYALEDQIAEIDQQLRLLRLRRTELVQKIHAAFQCPECHRTGTTCSTRVQIHARPVDYQNDPDNPVVAWEVRCYCGMQWLSDLPPAEYLPDLTEIRRWERAKVT